MTEPRLALVAGEASGDALAASIALELHKRFDRVELQGVCGPRMRQAGVVPAASVDELGVMGLAEVLVHVPRLARLRRRLCAHWLQPPVDAFIGVDAPDFNLGLARALKQRGIVTVQVVAPTVWAWRPWRRRRVARSVDLLLTLFPFEPECFRDSGLHVRFIGHPLADAMPIEPDRAAARAALGIAPSARVFALLPGSRGGEIDRHARLLADTARRLQAEADVLLLPLAAAGDIERFAAAAGAKPGAFGFTVIVDRTGEALVAADVAVAASGTVTLEALLAHTPVVVYYRLAGATYRLARVLRLVRSRFIALPNLLAGRALVPERIQHEARPDRLAADALAWLNDAARRAEYERVARAIHRQLARDAAASAARAIAEHVAERTGSGAPAA